MRYIKGFNEKFQSSFKGDRLDPDSNDNIYFINTKEHEIKGKIIPEGTIAYHLSSDGNYELENLNYFYVVAKDIEQNDNWQRITYHEAQKLLGY